MSKHYTNNELKEFANGNFSVKNLVAASKHIAQCSNCNQNLKKIAPTFFTDSVEQNLVTDARHFSDEEITAFLKAETPLQHRLQMSEHFRNCEVCKAKLYQSNPMFLKQTIAAYLNKEDETKKKSFFSTLNALIPIGAMAVLLIGILGYILLIEFRTNTEQVKVIEPIESSSPFPNLQNDSNPVVSNKNTDVNEKNTTNNPSQLEINQHLPITKSSPVSKEKRINSSNSKTNIIISPSRSAKDASNCEPEVAAIAPVYERITEIQPTFRWKPVANAVKYHLYISDTAQILIEEAETKESSYKLKASLEPNKQYKWKVVATMPDGKTLNSPSIEFSLGKTPLKYKFSKKKIVNETRCLSKSP